MGDAEGIVDRSLFDFALMKRQRDRIANRYRRVSVVQQAVEDELLSRLQFINLPVESILVFGAGNIGTINHLAKRFQQANLHVVDFSSVMLQSERELCDARYLERVRWELHDQNNLALDDAVVDLIFSNLHVSTSDNLLNLLYEFNRVLKPTGCVHFSTLGPDTFKQLRTAWAQVDHRDSYHVLEPPDMHDIGDALIAAGFVDPVIDRDDYQLMYVNTRRLWQDLRANGVRNYFLERQKGLTGGQKWRRFEAQLSSRGERPEIVLSIETVIAQAWKGNAPQQRRLDDGSVSVPVQNLKCN